MNKAKIQFSASEMELMNNAEIILTKNRIIEKTKRVLENLQQQMLEYHFPELNLAAQPFFAMPPKISKGENYLGLPYLILDYPRHFKQDSIFALRTMFWWGKFFSLTLHVAGGAKVILKQNIENAYEPLAKGGYFMGINDDPWQHHFEQTNFKNIALCGKDAFVKVCREAAHLKIAAHWPLSQVAAAANELMANWIRLLQICFP